MNTIVLILTIVLFIAGFVGIFIPGVPGVALIFAGFLVGAVSDGFDQLKWWMVLIAALLAVVSLLIDQFGTLIGVKRYKGSGWAVLGAFIGIIVGIFVGGCGVFVFPIVIAAAFEYAFSRDLNRSIKSGVGAVVGMFISAFVNLFIAAAIIGMFLISRPWR